MGAIQIGIADLTKQRYECLVNAANGIGPMGRGIAGALKRAGGDVIQSNAFAVCRQVAFVDSQGKSHVGYQAGQAYEIIPGRLAENGVKSIICAVTMHQPNDPTSVEICKRALHAAMEIVLRRGYKTVGLPAFGTGVGNLDKYEVANMMVQELDAYKNAVEIHINDINTTFVKACCEKQMQIEGWTSHPFIGD